MCLQIQLMTLEKCSKASSRVTLSLSRTASSSSSSTTGAGPVRSTEVRVKTRAPEQTVIKNQEKKIEQSRQSQTRAPKIKYMIIKEKKG